MEGLREIGVIWRGELARALKSGRVVVLLVLFMLFTGLALTIVGWAASQINKQGDQQFNAQIQDSPYKDDLDPAKVKETKDRIANESKKKFVSTFFADDDESFTEALLSVPIVVLIVFKIALRFVPFFIALMGFDQIAAEIGNRSIRYLVVRSRRSSIVLGKYLAQTTILALLMAVSVLAMVIVARVVDADLTVAKMALTFGKFWVAAVVLSVAYLALTSLCSSLFRQAPVSLVFNIIALFVVWFIALIGEAYRFPGQEAAALSMSSLSPESAMAYVRYASVWHYAGELLHPAFSKYGVAALAHVGFGLVFIALSYVVLRARDV